MVQQPCGGSQGAATLQAGGRAGRDIRDIDEQDLEKLHPNIILRTGKNVGKLVCLTFYDGPGEDLSGSVAAIPQVIDRLRVEGQKFLTMDEMFNLTAEDCLAGQSPR